MELSLVKTLAKKYKTSCQKIYRRYSTTITLKEGTYKVFQVIVERDSKKPLESHFGGVFYVGINGLHSTTTKVIVESGANGVR